MNAHFLGWLPMDAGDAVQSVCTYRDYVLVFTVRGRILKIYPDSENLNG